MARAITDFKKYEPSYETFNNEEEHPDKIKYVKKLAKDGYTLEDAVERLGFGRFQIMVGCMSGFAWVADGMEIMVLSILGPVLLCEWNLQTWEEALITTVVFIGFLIGSPVFGWLSDKYGRRKGLIMSTVWICYYGIVSAVSPSLAWLLILRLLVGFGVGGGPQAVTYYSEFLPNKLRGRLIILVEVFWAIGGMLEVVLAILVLEPFGWRWWLVASALPTALFLVFCYFLPESPRYEIVTGNPEKAQAIFVKAAKMNGTSLPPGKLLLEKWVPRGRPQDLVISEFRLTSGLLSFLWFVAAFSYYGIILFTTGLIRSGSTCSAAVDAEAEEKVCNIQCDSLYKDDYLDLLWTAAAELPGLLLTAVLVDLLGRKKTMIMEFLLFGFFCFILFICMSRIPMLIMLFIARAFISSAFQVLYVYTPEVYPTKIRALSVGFGSAFGRIGAIITPYIAEVLLEKSLHMALGVYATLGVLAAFVAFILPIETKGKDMKRVGSFHQQ